MEPKKLKSSVLILRILCFISYSGYTVFVTLFVPITHHYFGWEERLNGVTIIGLGGLCLINFVLLFIKLDDRIFLTFGFFLMTGAMYLFFPFPFEKSLTLWQFLVGAIVNSIGHRICDISLTKTESMLNRSVIPISFFFFTFFLI